MIGEGELKSECMKVACELGISDAVEFLGKRSTQYVRDAMTSASVFVQHSVTSTTGDKEGWPVAVAEAAASGLPIVATRHASLPEQVLHEESGVLVDENDWRAMAKAMIRLAEDANLRRRMGEAARNHLSSFDVNLQIESLEKVLVQAGQK